jgi:c-di-GMP-binding flagellar brake protein YcgR
MNSGMAIPLHKNQRLELNFSLADAMYTGKTVIEEISSETIPIITVGALQEVKRIQRRQYYRVQAALPMTLTQVGRPSDGLPDDPGQALQIVTHSYDISGYGISFDSSFPIAPGTVFSITLTKIDQVEALELKAYVVRSVGFSAPGSGYRIGLAFIDISKEYRCAIVRHIYQIQIENRPKKTTAASAF